MKLKDNATNIYDLEREYKLHTHTHNVTTAIVGGKVTCDFRFLLYIFPYFPNIFYK